MKKANPVYANGHIKDASMRASNRFWVIVFIDQNGLEKSELVYSFHVLTIETAKRFCHRPVTRVYSYVGEATFDCCDHILPIFIDAHG